MYKYLLLNNWFELYPQFFLELIITQLRFHMVSPQLVLLKQLICSDALHPIMYEAL